MGRALRLVDIELFFLTRDRMTRPAAAFTVTSCRAF
jgi:hypothetical protein